MADEEESVTVESLTLIKSKDKTILSLNGEHRPNDNEEEERNDPVDHDPTNLQLHYSLNEVPPWHLSLLLALQHYLTMFGGMMPAPFILSPAICVLGDTVAKAEIFSTFFFVSGVITALQSTIGTRLPIVQGATFSLLVPTLAIMSLDKWQCPTIIDRPQNESMLGEEGVTGEPPIFTGSDEHREVWQLRMREIQGAIILASLFEVFVGFSGSVGLILRYIGPLTIAPTIGLIGLGLFGKAAELCSQNWLIALLTILLVILFSQYLRNVELPFCRSRPKNSTKIIKFHVFSLFAVILAILLAWCLCAILTATNAFPDDPDHWAYAARTDLKFDVLLEAKWFRVPYPGQWGTPTFSTAAVFGMLAGILASTMESVGDYYACARLCGAPPLPVHAVNRGIFIEGMGSLLAGCWGSGNGTTSYSVNIGALALTKVGSRRVIQITAVITLVLAVIGKFGALFVTVPEPILGGVFMVLFGMVIATGLSNLQFVDLNSSRNLFIFGFSLLFGLSLPRWMSAHQDAIKTGSDVVDQILTVLLSTSMFVGGLLGFILDNTVPGTLKERGILTWQKFGAKADTLENIHTYDLPYVTKYLRRWKWTNYVPISPTFTGSFNSKKAATDNSIDHK